MENEMELIQPNHPPSFPNLQTFLLQENTQLQQISDSFFSHMKGLMHLDLSYCFSIRRLPDSISNLENLRALVLSSCEALEYVPSLAKLRKLKELDLFDCKELKDAPDGMEELVNLRYLNIKDSKELKLRWDLLSSKFLDLEDLRLEWSMNNIMVEDLMKLQKLERLDGWMCDIQDFNRYINALRHNYLNHCKILVQLKRGHMYLSDRIMRIEKCGPGEGMPVLPSDLQQLIMESCDFGGVRSIVDVGVPSLHDLTILQLSEVANLKALAMGGVLLPSSLKKLMIFKCHELEQIFSTSQVLPNLESILIEDCKAVEEIFGEPHLDEKIKVINLPKLTLA
ncbi:hypothetical protein Ancab_040666 [Ancistrocladus abbreviatus]